MDNDELKSYVINRFGLFQTATLTSKKEYIFKCIVPRMPVLSEYTLKEDYYFKAPDDESAILIYELGEYNG